MQTREKRLAVIPEDTLEYIKSSIINPTQSVQVKKGYESPVLPKSVDGKICSHYVNKDLTAQEIKELEAERMEILGLTPVPGYQIVTRKTYLKLKEKRKTEVPRQLGLEPIKSSERKSLKEQLSKPLYYVIPDPDGRYSCKMQNVSEPRDPVIQERAFDFVPQTVAGLFGPIEPAGEEALIKAVLETLQSDAGCSIENL